MSWSNAEWPRHRARLMAATMQPIEKQAHDEQLWRELTDWLGELNEHDDELKCQMIHRNPSNCSTEVTHRLDFCTGTANICDRGATLTRKRFALPTGRCGFCNREVRACWKLWAI